VNSLQPQVELKEHSSQPRRFSHTSHQYYFSLPSFDIMATENDPTPFQNDVKDSIFALRDFVVRSLGIHDKSTVPQESHVRPANSSSRSGPSSSAGVEIAYALQVNLQVTINGSWTIVEGFTLDGIRLSIKTDAGTDIDRE
jgi:hypothetical protein